MATACAAVARAPSCDAGARAHAPVKEPCPLAQVPGGRRARPAPFMPLGPTLGHTEWAHLSCSSVRFTAHGNSPRIRGTGASLGEAALFSTRGDGAASLAPAANPRPRSKFNSHDPAEFLRLGVGELPRAGAKLCSRHRGAMTFSA